MKNYKHILVVFAAMLFLSSCEDQLSPEPTAGISTDTYYNNADEVETAVLAIYDAIQGVNSTSSNVNHSIQYEFYLTEMRSDNTRTKAQEGEAAQFEFYTIEATNGIVADYYASFYEIIARANVVLANIGVIADPADAARLEAEAKFLRAYAYFNLVRLYGDIPLITSVISPSDTDVQFTRVATTQVYNQIESDLQFAVAHLGAANPNRASKAAAQALLAKLSLTMGNYSQAQNLCEDVINSMDYMLEPDFNDVFYNEGNSEVIFSIGYQTGLSGDSQNFSAEWMNAVGRTSGVNYVTQDAVAFLDDHGGDRTQYSYRIDPYQPSQNQVVKYLPNGEDGGADGKTFSLDPTLSGNDWIVLRYADVLLMHVEAILAGGSETSSSNALQSFNEVRQRAGLADDDNGMITKEELLNERRAELAFENHRLFDLIRFGMAETVLSDFSAANGLSYTSTDLLLPIPQREINLSKGAMSQNPGY